MSIERKNNLGYASWTIVDDVNGDEIMSCNTYYEAVNMLTFLNEVAA